MLRAAFGRKACASLTNVWVWLLTCFMTGVNLIDLEGEASWRGLDIFMQENSDIMRLR